MNSKEYAKTLGTDKGSDALRSLLMETTTLIGRLIHVKDILSNMAVIDANIIDIQKELIKELKDRGFSEFEIGFAVGASVCAVDDRIVSSMRLAILSASEMLDTMKNVQS